MASEEFCRAFAENNQELVGNYPGGNEAVMAQIAQVDEVTISGAAWTGKDTVIKKVILEPPIPVHKVTAVANRDIRDGEVDGWDYDFIDEEGHDELKLELIERSLVQATFGSDEYHVYGSRSSAYPESGYAIMDVMVPECQLFRSLGFRSVRNIHLVTRDFQSWDDRRIARKDTMPEEDVIKRKEEGYKSGLIVLDDPEFVVVINDDIDRTADEVRGIIYGYEPTERSQVYARNKLASFVANLAMDLGGKPKSTSLYVPPANWQPRPTLTAFAVDHE